MSEHNSDTDTDTDVPATAAEPIDEAGRQLAERTEDLQRVTDQAAERFAGQLFPIVDDIERARDHGDLTGAFKVVADRVLGLLDGLGVTAFGTAGDPFDPALHEAVLHDTSPDVSVPTASTVLRPGFRRGDRVLRTAMVGVTDPESPAAAPAAPAGDVVDGTVVDSDVIDGEVVDEQAQPEGSTAGPTAG
jgi:molecular chaperone GrpE